MHTFNAVFIRFCSIKLEVSIGYFRSLKSLLFKTKTHNLPNMLKLKTVSLDTLLLGIQLYITYLNKYVYIDRELTR